jgi:hypothetical protein
MIEEPGAAGTGWRAELEIPLSQMGVGAGPLTRVSLGMPWRREGTAGEPLPFTVSNGMVRITVPNAVPSLEAWGGKVSPNFAVEGAAGQRVLLEARPQQLSRDTTTQNVRDLEETIATLSTMLTSMKSSADELRAFLANPTAQRSGQHAAQPAELTAALKDTDAALVGARAAAQARFDAATPTERLMVAVTALQRQRTPAADAQATELIALNNQAVKARAQATQQADLLAKLRPLPLLSSDELAHREAELVSSQSAATQAGEQSAAALERALGALPADQVLSAADDRFGDKTLRSLTLTRDNLSLRLSFSVESEQNSLASRTQSARNTLPGLEASIARTEAQLADARKRLQSPAEVVTIDVH